MCHLFAKSGYARLELRGAAKGRGCWRIEIIKRSDAARSFVALPRHRVIEQTIAWLGRCRRRTKDWEASASSAEAWLPITHIRVMIRRLASLRTSQTMSWAPRHCQRFP
jgi:transposase